MEKWKSNSIEHNRIQSNTIEFNRIQSHAIEAIEAIESIKKRIGKFDWYSIGFDNRISIIRLTSIDFD